MVGIFIATFSPKFVLLSDLFRSFTGPASLEENDPSSEPKTFPFHYLGNSKSPSLRKARRQLELEKRLPRPHE